MDEHDERDPGTIRLDDPWRDDTVSGDGCHPGTAGVPGPRARAPYGEPAGSVPQVSRPAGPDSSGADPSGPDPVGADPGTAVYLEVHRSPAFREVRRRYRRFVFPASLLFLGWYFAYVVASTAAPEFMARPVVGTLNVALLAGLGQFATTFLLTWAYARHARMRRDRAAMDLRWTVYEQTRQHGDAGREQER